MQSIDDSVMDAQCISSGVYFSLRSMIAEMSNQTDHEPDFPLFAHAAGGQKPIEQRLRCLPIVGISIEAQVISTIARTTLVQTFTNFSSKAISEADYIFPLYYGSVIISFRCLIGDEKVLVGTVKPKAEAKVEYERAVERLEVAALLEEHTTEIFETKIGNIPPKATVKVEIVYATELKYDLGGNGVVLTIPTSIAPRYGTPAVDTHSWMDGLAVDGLKINVNVSCPDLITKLESQTHPISVCFGKPQSKAVSSFSDLTGNLQHDDPTNHLRNMVARLSDPAAKLEKDFVLLIHANGVAYTRSRAIMSPSHVNLDQAAMMVSISPQEVMQEYKTPGGFQGDIIILADQSSSMNGSKNKLLREIVNQALELLPKTCRLNVMAFGDKCRALWEQPCPYNKEEMTQAKDFISKFRGDMGGTRLLPALEVVIRSLSTPEGGSTQTSTQVIILTDAEVWEADKIIDRIRQWRKERGEKIRFFAFGIGDQVSHHLLESLATTGGGYADVIPVRAHEDRWEKIRRMIVGACMPPNWNLDITLDGFKRYEPLAVTPNDESQWYLQSPHEILPLHPFSRQSIFFLFKPGLSELPSHIVAKLSSETGGHYQITISVVKEQSAQSCIHTLTAKAIISDLDSRYQSLPSAGQQDGWTAARYVDVTPTVKKIGEQLGCTYSVASRWTSFLAVDSANKSEKAADLYELNANPNLMLGQPLSRTMQPTTLLSPGGHTIHFGQPQSLPLDSLLQTRSAPLVSTRKSRLSTAPRIYISEAGDLSQESHRISTTSAYLPSIESLVEEEDCRVGCVPQICCAQELESVPIPDIKAGVPPAGPTRNAVPTLPPPLIPLLRTPLHGQDEAPAKPKTLLELHEFLISDRAGKAITFERLGIDLPPIKERSRWSGSLRPSSQIKDRLVIIPAIMIPRSSSIDKYDGLVVKVNAALYSLSWVLHIDINLDFLPYPFSKWAYPFSKWAADGERPRILRLDIYKKKVKRLERLIRIGDKRVFRTPGIFPSYIPLYNSRYYMVDYISYFTSEVRRRILKKKSHEVRSLIHGGQKHLTRMRFCILIERYLRREICDDLLHKLGNLAKEFQDAGIPKEAVSLQLLMFGKKIEPPPPSGICVTELASDIANLQLYVVQEMALMAR